MKKMKQEMRKILNVLLSSVAFCFEMYETKLVFENFYFHEKIIFFVKTASLNNIDMVMNKKNIFQI